MDIGFIMAGLPCLHVIVLCPKGTSYDDKEWCNYHLVMKINPYKCDNDDEDMLTVVCNLDNTYC